MTVTVRRVGRGMVIVIPMAIARKMQLAKGTAFDVNATVDRMVLRRRGRLHRPLARVVAGIKPANYRRRRRELGQDPPVGNELC